MNRASLDHTVNAGPEWSKLSPPPRRAFLHTSPMVAYPACMDGPCKQGRALCPSPEACGLAWLDESDKPVSRGRNWVVMILASAGIWALLIALARHFWGGQ